GHPLSRNVARYQCEPFFPQVQEVEIIATYLASLNALTRIFECSDERKNLREESRLNPFCDFKFIGGSLFRFQFPCSLAPLRLDFPVHLVELRQGEGIPVRIHEVREDAAPDPVFPIGAGLAAVPYSPQAR